MDDTFDLDKIKKEYINRLYQVNEIPTELKEKMRDNLDKTLIDISYGTSQNIQDAGSYCLEKKEILIFKDHLTQLASKENLESYSKATMIHEMTHASSTQLDENGNAFRTGFYDYSRKAGLALNEGITQYYTKIIYDSTENNKNEMHSYDELVSIATDLVDIYGNDTIINAYINGPEELEKLMEQDNKCYTEFREMIDDYHGLIYRREHINDVYSDEKVSQVYDKIGMFIEDIKEKRNLKDVPSHWKDTYDKLLAKKHVVNYTIKELYNHMPLVEETMANDYMTRMTFSTSNKMKFVKGLKLYQNSLNQIPGLEQNSDQIINKILNNIDTAIEERNQENSVAFNEKNNKISFKSNTTSVVLYRDMAKILTKIAFDNKPNNSKYSGLYNARSQYLSDKLSYLTEKEYYKEQNYTMEEPPKNLYDNLIELYGEKAMLELNNDTLIRIEEDLKRIDNGDKFFDTYNALYNKDLNIYKDNPKQIINQIIQNLSQLDRNNNYIENDSVLDSELESKQNLEPDLNLDKEQTSNIIDEKPRKSWFSKLKERFKSFFARKKEPVLLNETNPVDIQSNNRKNEFIESIKVDTSKLSHENQQLSHKKNIDEMER